MELTQRISCEGHFPASSQMWWSQLPVQLCSKLHKTHANPAVFLKHSMPTSTRVKAFEESSCDWKKEPDKMNSGPISAWNAFFANILLKPLNPNLWSMMICLFCEQRLFDTFMSRMGLFQLWLLFDSCLYWEKRSNMWHGTLIFQLGRHLSLFNCLHTTEILLNHMHWDSM